MSGFPAAYSPVARKYKFVAGLCQSSFIQPAEPKDIYESKDDISLFLSLLLPLPDTDFPPLTH